MFRGEEVGNLKFDFREGKNNFTDSERVLSSPEGLGENATDSQTGQPGTKRLVEKYGDSLVCVRFKYDEKSRQRLKTVELIIERSAWSPPLRYADDSLVPLRIEAFDMPLRLQAKAAGGRWNPEKKLWFVKPVPSDYECHSANTGYTARSPERLLKIIYIIDES